MDKRPRRETGATVIARRKTFDRPILSWEIHRKYVIPRQGVAIKASIRQLSRLGPHRWRCSMRRRYGAAIDPNLNPLQSNDFPDGSDKFLNI